MTEFENTARTLRLEGGNIFDRIGNEFILPDVFFSFLLRAVNNRERKFVTSSNVSRFRPGARSGDQNRAS